MSWGWMCGLHIWNEKCIQNLIQMSTLDVYKKRTNKGGITIDEGDIRIDIRE